MPLYFAYGSNMAEAALRTRCPKARALCRARLPRHAFVLMRSGFASVRRDPRCDVHGMVFDLALSDVAPLDRYEGIAQGLYVKAVQPVVREGGAAARALIYIGTDAGGGSAPATYMEEIIAAAKELGLPPAYVSMLQAHAAPFAAARLRARNARPAL